MNTTALLAAEVVPAGSDARLIIAAVAGVAVIIALITWLDLHPFLALSIGAVGRRSGGRPRIGRVGRGIRDRLRVDNGKRWNPDRFRRDVRQTPRRFRRCRPSGRHAGRPFQHQGASVTMALVGAVIGLPMFFEIGLVLLMPVIILVARRSGLSLMRIAIPHPRRPLGHARLVPPRTPGRWLQSRL